MKIITIIILKVLLIIVIKGSFIWAIVEFTLHLVKDKIFNWNSVYTFVIGLILAIVLAVFEGIYRANQIDESRKKVRKSKFFQRLEEVQKSKSN